tara:strand:+ start:1307 stop:1891 length:585 start_codon:yes stop_codon:yes gene_type:complete
MNLAFYSEPIEKAIVEEIRQWSAEVLEQPNPYFNNLPACPYARSAWMDNKVSILFKNEPSLQVLYTCISQFDDAFDLLIIVDLNPDEDSDAFHEYLDQLNDVISEGMFIDKDIWVMGFHPHDDPSDFVEEVVFEREIDTAYSMTFVQRLSKLQKAADKLHKKGYYHTYDNEYQASDIYEKRENLYRRLKNGDET